MRATLSADENLVVGMLGGTAEVCINMPILTWKFCRQEGRPYPKFPGMYRGLLVQAGSVAPLTAMQMVANGALEKLLTNGTRQLNELETVGCALGAGALSASLYAPVDMTMIHQQKLGLNPLSTIGTLAKQHGIASLWRGVGATALREGIYTAGYLGLAPVFTAKLMKQPGWEESYFASAVIGSSAAAIIANLASHPIDTAKTVLQADVTGTQYKSFPQALSTLYKANGFRQLYLGGIARTLRGCIAFFVVSSLREKCIQNKSHSGSPWVMGE